ncbi:hypothetical protein GCM10017600_43040 [Streptosporangium carneum]|uniref:Thiaminase-2/PQQC domain-containing protein n=1 Tax=Streptosporangium carneum TaxID=47481 RepID=A0A9W6I487_9ACTN|nr:hypothetical protein GCM10017600_43040 [Streptosporangium carneum]
MPVSFLPVKPCLRASLRIGEKGEAELHTSSGILEVEAPEGMSRDDFLDLLKLLDGSRTIEDLERETGLDGEAVREIVEPAVVWGLVDEGAVPVASSERAALSRLDAVLSRLLEDLVLAGPFWREVLQRPERLSHNVFYGFWLERWLLLFGENGPGPAVLGLAWSAGPRRTPEGLHRQERRHGEIAARALGAVGVTRDDLSRARPLSTTTALTKMLSWWARTDPLFFAAAVGVLERPLGPAGGAGGHTASVSFPAACDRAGLASGFVESMRAHTGGNAVGGHGSVSREPFTGAAGIDEETERRWHAKAHLFMEAYAAFHNGVLEHYSDPRQPLLRVAEI